MTYKNREVQPELFTRINKKRKQNLLNKNIFCSHYKSAISVSLDTLIVIIIGILMVNLSSFVLGMERGKNSARSEFTLKNCSTIKGNAAVPVKENKKQTIVQEEKIKPEETEAEKIETQNTVETVVTENPRMGNPTGYIIQLVTYSSNTNAAKEVSRLKSLGVNGHVLKSGQYYVVYSGMYNTKNKANEQMADFKKRYKDCFVRFLKNS